MAVKPLLFHVDNCLDLAGISIKACVFEGNDRVCSEGYSSPSTPRWALLLGIWFSIWFRKEYGSHSPVPTILTATTHGQPICASSIHPEALSADRPNAATSFEIRLCFVFWLPCWPNCAIHPQPNKSMLWCVAILWTVFKQCNQKKNLNFDLRIQRTRRKVWLIPKLVKIQNVWKYCMKCVTTMTNWLLV